MMCPQCHAPLPADAPPGICPPCALLMAMRTQTPATTAPGDAGVTRQPDQVGPWRILRPLGVGGMGAVYQAEQAKPIRRQAALKIVKPGMGSAEIIRRFESERQALALMDHPNIARVYDAGSTADGRPYFAMEYVDGIPITAYCDRHALPARERLLLFADVCRAIQHAHQKGVIHRDIKPSNVMVAEREGKAVPTVIDFGIAKAVDHRLAGETIFTQQGLLVGTPEYMSPEQAASSADIDTTTDVYSLGVLLYELLTGVLPFDVKAMRQEGYLAILRAVREDDPPRPVTRLRGLGDTAAGMASKRRTTLGGLIKQVGGDLEWITMRALEKERSRRYASASALADDIERHLRDEPVAAGPPGRLYQINKFVRRHRGLVAAVAGVVLALAIGLVLTTAQYLRAERQRELADRNAREAAVERSRAQGEAQRADASSAVARTAQSEAEQSRDRAETERQRAENETEAGRRLLYAADMSRLPAAWEETNLFLVEDLLDRHYPQTGKPDLRGWEWFYYWGRLNDGLKMFDGEGPWIAFSPDGRTLGMSGPCPEGGGSRLWDFKDSRSRVQMDWSFGRGIVFAPDGKTFAVSQYNAPISIIDSSTTKEIAQIPITAVNRMAYSPDGSLLAFSAMLDASPLDPLDPVARRRIYGLVVKLWNVRTGREHATLAGSGDSQSVSFSPDGNTVAVARGQGIRFFDVASGKAEPSWIPDSAGHAPKVAVYSTDGRWLAEGGTDGAINIWDVVGHTKLQAIAATPGPSGNPMINDLAFSADGRLLAVAREDRLIMVYSTEGWTPRRTLRAHGETAASVAFSPDGKLLVSGGSECRVRLWDVDTILAQGPLEVGRVSRIAYSPDGRLMAIYPGVSTLADTRKGELTIWDVAKKTKIRTLNGPSAFMDATWSPDGTLLAAGDFDFDVTVWRVGSGEQHLRIEETGRRSVQVASYYGPTGNFARFSRDGKTLVTGHSNGGASLWNVASGRRETTLGGTSHRTYTAAFSPNGSQMTLAGDCTFVGDPGKLDAAKRVEMTRPGACAPQIWSLSERRSIRRLSAKEYPTNQIAYSPDGHMVAVLTAAMNVELWEAATGRLIKSLKGAKQGGRCLAFSPDGSRIMLCDERELLFWDVTSGQMVSAIRAGGRITHAAFSPDGRTVAFSGPSPTVIFLDTPDPRRVPTVPRKRPVAH